MMRHLWLLNCMSIRIKGPLVDQDMHVRAELVPVGDEYYCDVWVNLHDPPVRTAVNSFAWGAMEEAEGMLLDAGIEL
jgi:hypothetical protein